MEIKPNQAVLLDVFRLKIPFGKYKGTIIKDIPTYYLELLSKNGFKNDRLGQALSTIFIIKTENLLHLLKGIDHTILQNSKNRI